MKFFSHSGRRRVRQRAFTLAEVMVAMAVAILVVSGVIFSHITGLRMYEIVKSKLGASDDTREAISFLIDEVRSGKTIKVGNFDGSVFTQAADGTPQEGNAIQIFPSTNLTQVIQYYLDTNQAKLYRVKSSQRKVVASYVTNAIAFQSEDHGGNVLSENQRNRVIALTLNFYQIQYPSAPIGSNQLYETYQMKTKITRRVLANR